MSRLNGLLALVLSIGVVLAASGALVSSSPQGDVWVCVAALSMTVPVAWRRSAPLAAIAALAAGALFNWLVVGSYVRCGATLPALFLCLYSVADGCELQPALLGAALGLVSGIAQAHSDPKLQGFTVGACVLTALVWGAGRMVRARQAMVVSLRARNDELREERDRTAKLAVATDRAQLARSLDTAIGEQIGRVESDAAAALEIVDAEPDDARTTLETIEGQSRRMLTEMRELVGTLRDEQPRDPQPSLADLDALIASFGGGRAVLTIEGDRSRLPAGVELSAFRIIERLLEPLEGIAGARVAVALRYTPEELRVRVHGKVRSDADVQAPLTAAREWVSLYAGRLDSEVRSGVAITDVRLPLVTAHA